MSDEKIGGPCFIIPYRDRAEHLTKWLNHYKQIFQGEIPIIVVEQADSLGFARAPLFNVAFLEAGKNYDYCIFHDVDMMIDLKKSDPIEAYSFPRNPTHIAVHLERFRFNEAYHDFFGGVCIISSKQMYAVDGWHNSIFSWSPEDSEMRDNLLSHGYEIDRRPIYFKEEKHKRNLDVFALRSNVEMINKGRKEGQGMKDQRYKILLKEHNGVYLHIKVSFE